MMLGVVYTPLSIGARSTATYVLSTVSLLHVNFQATPTPGICNSRGFIYHYFLFVFIPCPNPTKSKD